MSKWILKIVALEILVRFLAYTIQNLKGAYGQIKRYSEFVRKVFNH